MKQTPIVIATIRPWNLEQYACWEPPKGYVKHLVSSKDELSLDRLQEINPAYVFFPHWSWIIPREIFERFHCVVFHMTDLPFGRGGSPLQNLLVRGIYETQISAIAVEDGVDTGPVYMKRPFQISTGSAEDIFRRGSVIVYDMITGIVLNNPTPTAQTGEPVHFMRRKPNESQLPDDINGRRLYDFIRMLDAPGYPRAYIKHGDTRYEFSDAQYDEIDETVRARAIIVKDV
jgi:methionyl-tRNA formyltransferase